MKSFRIALYPGDGIGREVTDETIRVLDALQQLCGDFELELTTFPWGADYYFEHGQVAPEDFLEILRPFDALFLGAVGDPNRLPDHITLAPLIRLRQSFDLYACVRPVQLFEGLRGPLADKTRSDVNLVVVRENSEGEYVNVGGRVRQGTPDEVTMLTAIHTRRGIERILRFGFELALTRRKRLTMITKSNAQKYGYVLWDELLDELQDQFPSVRADKQYVDAAAMNFVRCPEHFDVVVASNLFGDILSDLSGVIAGGLGLAPSANLNPERRFPSLFEPVHGSAPDIMGKGIANPIAAFLSAAMMLDWLDLKDAAKTIEHAVEKTLRRGMGTPDLGGQLTTTQLADEVIRDLESHVSSES